MRGADPELASNLRIEERELEAGRLEDENGNQSKSGGKNERLQRCVHTTGCVLSPHAARFVVVRGDPATRVASSLRPPRR